VRQNIADLVTGIVTAAVVFVAVPFVLVTLVGVPVPRHWTQASVLSAHGLFDLLAIVAWVAWVACCWPLLRSVGRRVRHRDTTAASGAHLSDRLAARIAAAVLVITSVSLTLGTVAGAATDGARSPATQSAPAPTGATPPRPDEGAASATPTVEPISPGPVVGGFAVPATYTVGPGDSLWSIAERFYGDGADWSAIAAVNLGQVMRDGRRFVDPSMICPGWVLSLPDLTQPGPAAEPPVVDPTSTAPSEPAASALADSPQPVATPAVVADAKRVGPRQSAGGVAESWPGRTWSSAARAALRPSPRATSEISPEPERPTPPVPLPELVMLGVGVLAAAALARRLRWSRHRAGLDPTGEVPLPSPDAADLATWVLPFDRAPVFAWVESANRQLTAALEATTEDVPGAQLLFAGPTGVWVWLNESVSWAPGPWELADEGRAWHLPAAVGPEELADLGIDHQPWLPALLPVGDNDDGTWLVPVEPGACLPVVGAQAEALVASMRRTIAAWSWAEQVVVTDDPAVAEREAEIIDQAAGGVERMRVLFIGDPALLGNHTRQRCGVLTTLPAEATDLTVTVDRRAASLHPVGITLRPHLLGHDQAAAVDELTGDAHGPTRLMDHSLRPPLPLVIATPEDSARSGISAGPVEVRLLTAIPRIEGLSSPIDPKRARRATELVAYLALHYPDPVTSDRLRTRVLGSADADAAAKTLFNTAGAARRALGNDPEGVPYLPPATKSGHYRISELVTIDAIRSLTLVAAAKDTDDPDEAMALHRAALELVEGAPLDGTLTGYAWWRGEGHDYRVAAALVDGACQLSRLATETGHLDLAAWALERGRLVEPYSEALTRAAMQFAATAGDADRLRREWVDCQRRVDELEPGSLPSERTERLYGQLRHFVPAFAGLETQE